MLGVLSVKSEFFTRGEKSEKTLLVVFNWTVLWRYWMTRTSDRRSFGDQCWAENGDMANGRMGMGQREGDGAGGGVG